MKEKLYTKLLLFSLLFPALIQAQDSGEAMFDNSFVHEVRFEFTQSNYWSTMVNNFESSFDPFDPVPYLMGKVIIDGEVVDSVGVRFKGFTSYPQDSDKKPIKIDFNEFVEGKRYDGLRKLNLNNSTGDPGMQRDVVCYDLHRSIGVKAPRTAYTKVYFNGEYWGLYQLIEQVDKEFLQNNFSNDQGNLFKNLGWSHLEWAGNNASAYNTTFQLKTNKIINDWSGFINLLDVINNTPDPDFKQAIEEVFNVDLFLKTLAVDVATNNWDSYLEHGRNWYLYEDDVTGIFHWIPWDYNFSLEGGLDFGGGDCQVFPDFISVPNGTTSIDFFDESFTSDDATYHWDFDDGITSTEENPKHTFASHGTYNVCLDVVIDQNCQEQICKSINTNDNLNDCGSIQDGSCPHPIGRTFAFVLDFDPSCCQIWGDNCEEWYSLLSDNGGNGSNGFAIDQRGNNGVLIKRLLNVPEFYDQYTAHFCDLMNYHFTTDIYHPLIDGNKALIDADVQADPNFLFDYSDFLEDIGDDGIKKVIADRIMQLQDELDMAAACNTAAIIPLRDAVVNELVASNDSSSNIADPVGEYDDWIELFNNTSSSIDLSDAFLSDDKDNLLKWPFPTGTTLAANGYLIVWADKEDDQPGLHASFKLNKEGDAVYFSNSDGSIIDSISFGLQSPNIALARNPNGTGDFINQGSTFNINNETATAITDLMKDIKVAIYPVPAGDFLQVEIQSTSLDQFSIDLLSVTGQLLQQNIPATANQVRLDLSNLPDGFYFLNIKDQKGNRAATKFVKAQP